MSWSVRPEASLQKVNLPSQQGSLPGVGLPFQEYIRVLITRVHAMLGIPMQWTITTKLQFQWKQSNSLHTTASRVSWLDKPPAPLVTICIGSLPSLNPVWNPVTETYPAYWLFSEGDKQRIVSMDKVKQLLLRSALWSEAQISTVQKVKMHKHRSLAYYY